VMAFGFFRSPFMKVKFGLFDHCLMFSIFPTARLSRMVTLCPSEINRGVRWLPMKPAPPVIRMLFISFN